MDTAGEVSVNPYASTRVVPVTFFQRSATARCTAMPPPRVIFRWLKSTLSKPGVLSRPLKRVLTPVMAENGMPESSFTKAGMSRGLVIKWFSAPNFMKTRQLAVRAKIW